MIFRPGTFDENIWKSVVDHNEYSLPDFISSHVIDVGAHIGSFAFAALSRGAPHVTCFEPCPKNFELLKSNLAQFIQQGRVTLHQAALGLRAGRATLTPATESANTGGGNVRPGVGPIKVISADSVFKAHKDFFLKLDCEGAEREILTLSSITRAVQIVGEYHYPVEHLKLPEKYHVRTIPFRESLGLFFATQKPERPSFSYKHFADSVGGYTRVANAVVAALDPTLTTAQSPTINLAPAHAWERGSIRMTTWETTKLPSLKPIEQSSVIVVPCTHNVECFRASGYLGPIEILPQWGAGSFAHLPPIRPFRFLCVARDNGAPTRKGLDELIAWFTEAFQRQSDVSLTIKQSPNCKRRYTYDKRIHLIYEDFNATRYTALLASHHCGIFLSGAEAWNFPLCELMATGRPSICIPFGGPADFTTRDTSWHLPYKLIAAPREVYQSVGKVAFPDKRGTIQAMREAYSDQILLAEKAAASARMSHNYTEARFAARLRHIVAKYG